MAIVLMLSWWYSRGWLWVVQSIVRRLQSIGKTYAVKILIQTLFAPWKRIQTQSTFTTFFRDAIDNGISRAVGTVVRGSILLWALFLSILTILFGFVSLLIWPLLPLAIVILPALAIIGVSF